MLVALPYFLLVVLRGDEATDVSANFRARMMKWWSRALLLEAISGAVWFWFVAAQMADQSPWAPMPEEDLTTVLGQTWFGQLWLARGAAGVFLVGLMLVARFRGAEFPSLRSPLSWLSLSLSLGLLVSLAGAGHADAGIHDHLLHLAVDGAHLLLGAIWPMGLLPLGFYLRSGSARNRAVAGENELRILRRFSRVSLIVVLLLLLTGVINSFLMIESWEDLATTTYGRLLIGKIVVVLLMMFLGALNRRCLKPQSAAEPEMLRTLRRNVAVESCLGAVVLLIVGVMGMTPPPG